MQTQNLVRHFITVLLALVLLALTYKSTGAFSWNLELTVEAEAPQARPIPPAGPLANPKSLKQVGVPVEATRVAVPTDTSQTPAKIALCEKLFFDGRLSVYGTGS